MTDAEKIIPFPQRGEPDPERVRLMEIAAIERRIQLLDLRVAVRKLTHAMEDLDRDIAAFREKWGDA